MVSVTAKEAGDKWKGFALFEVRDLDQPGTPGEKATAPTYLLQSRPGGKLGFLMTFWSALQGTDGGGAE